MDNNHDLILVTNWDKVDTDDFYLSDEWVKSTGDKDAVEEARKLQKEGALYEAYIVTALNYAIYYQMDADKVFVNEDMEVILHCESAVIGNSHDKRVEYTY